MTETSAGLITERLSLGYGHKTIVPELDFTPPPGKFTALIGQNGCGKSTLLRALAGMQTTQGGRIVLDGHDIARMGTKALARRIGMLAQSPDTPDGLSVEDLVRQGRYPHRSAFGRWKPADSAAVNDALTLTGLTHLRGRPVDRLSGGQRQRAWIAMTLTQESGILLLDEPTTFLDLAHQIEVLSLMQDLVATRQATIVAVLHDISQAARHADRIVLLHRGRILAEGTPAEVITEANLRTGFGVEVTISPDPETGAPLCIPRRTVRG